MEFTWYYVKDKMPRKKGFYLVATKGNKRAIPSEYEGGKFYLYKYETESGGRLEIAPYAWAEYPERPTIKKG